jgi:hypothetical protein
MEQLAIQIDPDTTVTLCLVSFTVFVAAIARFGVLYLHSNSTYQQVQQHRLAVRLTPEDAFNWFVIVSGFALMLVLRFRLPGDFPRTADIQGVQISAKHTLMITCLALSFVLHIVMYLFGVPYLHRRLAKKRLQREVTKAVRMHPHSDKIFYILIVSFAVGMAVIVGYGVPCLYPISVRQYGETFRSLPTMMLAGALSYVVLIALAIFGEVYMPGPLKYESATYKVIGLAFFIFVSLAMYMIV